MDFQDICAPSMAAPQSSDKREASFRLQSSDLIVANIQDKLDALISENNIKILFACESGSRVWGFSSANSDYDVRYVYSRPTEDYLTITERKGEIRALPDPVYDLVGWDLPKALGLLSKSNPNLGEWLNTDQLYRADCSVHSILKDLYNDNFSPGSLNHHYTSMAKRVWHEHLQGDNIEAKKYLYCARALLASEWLKTEQTFPSLSFDTLVESSSMNKLVKQELLEITTHKKSAQEKSLVGRSIILDDFIKERLSEGFPSEKHWLRGSSALTVDRLNCIFREMLAQVNGR